MPLTWSSVKVLEARCRVRFESIRAGNDGVHWRMTISPPEGAHGAPIVVLEGDITDAARSGLKAAVAAGWMTPVG